MSKQFKFLRRTNEIGQWFAELGRKLKSRKQAGKPDPILKEMYRQVREGRREQNVIRRHSKWRRVYISVFEENYLHAREYQKKTEKQARKWARQKAEQAVVDTFEDEVRTKRAVREAMKGFD